MSDSNQQPHKSSAMLQVQCPHCKEPINILPVMPPGVQTSSEVEQQHSAPPAVTIGRVVSEGLERWLFPATHAANKQTTNESRQPHVWVDMLRQHWKTFVALVAGMILVCIALIWWGRPLSLREQTSPAAQAAPGVGAVQPAPSSSAVDAETKAAILDTLTQYNRAETEAAALLTITPLQPFLLPNGTLAQRRATQLAERQQRQAPHRTMLLRWAIGDIAVHDTTATVITQETWSNQEANAVAPEQATVRVTYTLQWNEAARRWLIADSSQTAL